MKNIFVLSLTKIWNTFYIKKKVWCPNEFDVTWALFSAVSKVIYYFFNPWLQLLSFIILWSLKNSKSKENPLLWDRDTNKTMEWKPTRQSVNIFKVISSFLGHYWKRECENLLTWNFAPVSELLFSKTKNNKYGRNMVKVVSVTLNLVLLP